MSESFKTRPLPVYTRSEEVFNMTSHIAGGALAVIALIFSIIISSIHSNTVGIVTGVLYCISMLCVYVVSSVYHGLSPIKAGTGKRVMQVLDHCDIYWLIFGTFLPIAMNRMRLAHPVIAWVSFSIVLTVCVTGTVFTAIDMKKFAKISYACYFISGWSVIFSVLAIYDAYGLNFLIFLLAGGIVYTSGMIFFCLQKKHKFFHSIFHLFILGGSVLHFCGIALYVL